MQPVIELEECLKDSPFFREVIDENAEDVESLELKLDKLVRLCNGMVDAGKIFVNNKNAFVSGIKELGAYFEKDDTIVGALQRFVQALQEVGKYETILMDQAQRSVVKNVNKFVKTDIKQAKESKRHFEKISDDLDAALVRNSSAPKSKCHECDDANNLLTATRSCFRYTALDYVYHLSSLQSKKRFEVLDTLLSLMHAYTTYFHQGSDLFQDVDPFLKELDTTLNKLRSETAELEKNLDGRHTLVTHKDFVPTIVKLDDTSNSVIRLEGYLFKRTSNAFKTWNRRWFIIQNNQLVYRKRTKGDALTVMEEDLRLCTVKPALDLDRRFCFEVLSPSKSHVLQADSEEACRQWITAMQAGINAALHQTLNEETVDGLNTSSSNRPCSVIIQQTPPPKPPRASNQILSLASNEICCDCKSTDPRWASINLGITLCIECSGIHRSLGVHISKVRSLTLDAWEPELLKVMAQLGNGLVNSLYEAHVDETVAIRATHDCNRDVREKWIKAKYVKRAFVEPLREPIETAATNEINGEESTKVIATPTKWTVRKINRKHKVRNEMTDAVSCHSLATEGSKDQDIRFFGEFEHGTQTTLELDSADESTLDDDEEISDIPIDPMDDLCPNLLLFRAATVHNLPAMCQALSNGADPNWLNLDDKGQSPLHQAIRSGSIMACEYLMLNGGKCNNQDSNGWTTLHLATELGHTGQVCLLLKRGIDQNALDSEGRSALAVAIQNANADIVTLLRLAKLNEEMRRDEFGNPGDETFNDVVRDFTHMASHNPEKLRRNVNSSNSTQD